MMMQVTLICTYIHVTEKCAQLCERPWRWRILVNKAIFKVPSGMAPAVVVAPSKIPTLYPSKLGFSGSWKRVCSTRESSFNFQIDPNLKRKRTPSTLVDTTPQRMQFAGEVWNGVSAVWAFRGGGSKWV